MKNTKNATKISVMKRLSNGEQMRTQILFYIKNHPGITSYEIANKFNWSQGKVYYHVKKLINSGEIKIQRVQELHHEKKMLYVVSWQEMIDWNEMKTIKKEN